MLIRFANPMAATCGAVCPQEVFCQNACTRGKIDEPIAIRDLHALATGQENDYQQAIVSRPAKVAIIGAGPAGLSCAAKLVSIGIGVDIYEREDHIGGIPGISIPQFRLPDALLNKDIKYFERCGARYILNSAITDPTMLLDKYKAVFIATGLDQTKKLDLLGEELPEIQTALEFLADGRSFEITSLSGKKVVVIGGGNVSLDVATTAAFFEASEVHLTYRRGPQEMKAWKSELREAEIAGILIDYQISPIEFIGKNGVLNLIKFQRMELTNKTDPDGRRKASPIPGTEFIMKADLAIIAVGIISEFVKGIKVNKDLTTSVDGIFAGGDWAHGEGTIVEAVRDGKLAALKITAYLKERLP